METLLVPLDLTDLMFYFIPDIADTLNKRLLALSHCCEMSMCSSLIKVAVTFKVATCLNLKSEIKKTD